MRLVVIGGVAAGTKAASRARRLDPELEITVYQEEPEISISECGLPYFISGVVEERSALVARTPEDFAEQDVEVLTRHRVESVHPGNKRLIVKDLSTGKELEDSYDRLVISTGARAVLPPIEGASLDGVFALRFLSDADAITGYVRERSPAKAAVVGGGYIGLELAENLKGLGMEVAVVEAEGRVANTYGSEVSEKVEEHLKEKGVEVFSCEKVDAMVGAEGRVRGVRFDGEEVEAEMVIVGVGIEPAVGLAREAGARIGTTGALLVDKYLKTNLPDVWAAGDCVETANLVTKEPAWAPLGDTANQMGRVAGTNAASGEDVLEFPGVLGTGVFKVFDLAVAKTGLSEEEAEGAGFEVVTAAVDSKDRAGYYPGVESVFVKLVANAATGRLLGAEIVGGKADKYVDICATAIWGRLSYPDLVDLDLAYAPPFGPVLSPVISAASVLANKFEKKTEGVRATE
jgi:NADPH-dependent 2,4-dienoyl-CoA reductase/sulfur reductase-like enzyme